ncbi:MAG: disulfide bond formation protein B [Pseudomonadota bacterium]
MAALGSAALIVGAFAFQHLGGLPPCQMCIWQRYPHVIALAAGVLLLAMKLRALKILGLIAALTTSAIGFFHVGVEQGWWEGPTSCSSGNIAGISPEELLDQIMSAPLVRCDEIPWALMGISMAGWNAIISLSLAGLWLAALRQS